MTRYDDKSPMVLSQQPHGSISACQGVPNRETDFACLVRRVEISGYTIYNNTIKVWYEILFSLTPSRVPVFVHPQIRYSFFSKSSFIVMIKPSQWSLKRNIWTFVAQSPKNRILWLFLFSKNKNKQQGKFMNIFVIFRLQGFF